MKTHSLQDHTMSGSPLVPGSTTPSTKEHSSAACPTTTLLDTPGFATDPMATAQSSRSCGTYINNYRAINPLRYDKAYIEFCIKELSRRFGANKQFLITSLIKSGLRSHPIYSSVLDEINRAALEAGLLTSSNSIPTK